MSENEKAKAKLKTAPMVNPGVNREQRISDEGLQRLKKQFASGVSVSDTVLQQWIKRYGDDARVIIEKYREKRDI